MKNQKNKDKEEKEDLSQKKFALGSQYIAVERLGKGTYGTVYKAKERGRDTYFAIKKNKKRNG
jgi:serine/threonine protein kinase